MMGNIAQRMSLYKVAFVIKQAATTLDEASLHCKAALGVCEKFAELIFSSSQTEIRKLSKRCRMMNIFRLTMTCSSLTPPPSLLKIVPPRMTRPVSTHSAV